MRFNCSAFPITDFRRDVNPMWWVFGVSSLLKAHSQFDNSAAVGTDLNCVVKRYNYTA